MTTQFSRLWRVALHLLCMLSLRKPLVGVGGSFVVWRRFWRSCRDYSSIALRDDKPSLAYYIHASTMQLRRQRSNLPISTRMHGPLNTSSALARHIMSMWGRITNVSHCCQRLSRSPWRIYDPYHSGWAFCSEEYLLALFELFDVLGKRYIYGSEFCTERRAGFGVGCYRHRRPA